MGFPPPDANQGGRTVQVGVPGQGNRRIRRCPARPAHNAGAAMHGAERMPMRLLLSIGTPIPSRPVERPSHVRALPQGCQSEAARKRGEPYRQEARVSDKEALHDPCRSARARRPCPADAAGACRSLCFVAGVSALASYPVESGCLRRVGRYTRSLARRWMGAFPFKDVNACNGSSC